MALEVLLHPSALKAFQALLEQERARVREALARVAEDPFRKRSGADIRKLKGTHGRQDLYRVRVGELRVVYAVEDDAVLVTDLFRRGEGYDV